MNRIEGDNQLIIDSPTREFADGTKEVKYYFMAKEWPQLRDHARIIIDSEKLGHTTQLQFRNSNDSQVPWTAESCTIIPDGKVITGGISCHGLKHFILAGEQGDNFDGLTRWHPSRKYTTGHFGFHIINHDRFSGHGIDVSVLDGGSIRMYGFEVQYGFSGVRINSVAIPVTVNGIDIQNFYIHDTYKGEPFYFGSTQSGKLPKLKDLKVKNGFIARAGAEGMQFQHMIGGADVKDIILYAMGTNWLHSFGPGQDTGIQWVCASGDNRMSNIIVDGFASNGMIPFGSDQGIDNCGQGNSYLKNILFNNGQYRGIYLHNSARYGMKWHYDDIYFRDFNNNYLQTGKPEVDHFISTNHGSDACFFGNIYTDLTRKRLFEGTDYPMTVSFSPAPDYMCSGFHEPASRIKIWHQHYGKYHPNADMTPTEWTLGDIAIDATEDHYGFYKTVTPHSAGSVRPRDNSGWFMPLIWDANGVRNDQPGFQPETNTHLLPPDDLRLKPESYWRKKGFGIKGIMEKERILEEYYFNGKRHTITEHNKYIS